MAPGKAPPPGPETNTTRTHAVVSKLFLPQQDNDTGAQLKFKAYKKMQGNHLPQISRPFPTGSTSNDFTCFLPEMPNADISTDTQGWEVCVQTHT